MADDTDFVALYDELGLSSACSMADFKRAYRRRVAQLHPDHPASSSDLSRLQRINRLYAAALEFERAHGRLPGQQTAAHPARQESRRPHAVEASRGNEQPADVSGTGFRWRYVLLMVLLGVVLYRLAAEQPTATPVATKPDAIPRQTTHAPVTHAYLALGMEEDQVRRIQGEPYNSHQTRWEYGPSWILFDCKQVVDWYSSPLHPLQVQHSHPTENAKRSSAMLRKC